MPLKPLYVGIHSTSSRPPSISEVGRRSSIDSVESLDEDEEEDLNPELRDYIYRGEPLATSDAYHDHISRSDDGVEEPAPNRYSLTKGMSFLSYLLTNPRGSFNLDSRSKSSANLDSQHSSRSLESSPRSPVDKSDGLLSHPLTRVAEPTEDDLEKEFDGWDFKPESKDDISDTGRLSPVLEEDVKADSEDDVPINRSPGRDSLRFRVRNSLEDVRSIGRAVTYPFDDHGGDDNTFIDLNAEFELNRTASLRLEPNDNDQPLKGWRSPNLTPNSSTRTPFASLTHRSSSRNRSFSLSAEDMFLESKLDLELDSWKVPAEIDHILEDINLTDLDVEPPLQLPLRSSSRPRPSAQPRLRRKESAVTSVDSPSEDESSFYRDASEDSIPIREIIGRPDRSFASTSSNVSTNDLAEGLYEESKAAYEVPPPPPLLSPSADIKFSTFSPFIRKPSMIFQQSNEDLSDGVKTPTREDCLEQTTNNKREFVESIRRGDAYHARLMLLNGQVDGDDFTPEEASKTILWCVQNLDKLAHAEDTLRLLVEGLHGDVNYRSVKSETGAPPIMLCLHRPDIGRLLMSKGADIFLKDRSGTHALAASVSGKRLWLIEEFADSDQEEALFSDPDETKLREYVSWLVLAGYGKKLAKHIDRGEITVSAAQATILFSQCSDNFASMKEPVETYELLERLMSSAL